MEDWLGMEANRNNHPRSRSGSDNSLGQILRMLRTDSDGLMTSNDWMEEDSRSGEQGWPIMLVSTIGAGYEHCLNLARHATHIQALRQHAYGFRLHAPPSVAC
jgi:hypothetical protein